MSADKGSFAEDERSLRYDRKGRYDLRSRMRSIQAFTALAAATSESVVASLLAATHAVTGTAPIYLHSLHRYHARAASHLRADPERNQEQGY